VTGADSGDRHGPQSITFAGDDKVRDGRALAALALETNRDLLAPLTETIEKLAA
jgi:hypothetical protein